MTPSKGKGALAKPCGGALGGALCRRVGISGACHARRGVSSPLLPPTSPRPGVTVRLVGASPNGPLRRGTRAFQRPYARVGRKINILEFQCDFLGMLAKSAQTDTENIWDQSDGI